MGVAESDTQLECTVYPFLKTKFTVGCACGTPTLPLSKKLQDNLICPESRLWYILCGQTHMNFEVRHAQEH
jgi:hypothetical protein